MHSVKENISLLTTQKTRLHIITELVNNGINKAIDKLENRLEALWVKTPIVSLDPIKAKIGKKEGSKHEKRYLVWKYIENDGTIKPKKQGIVRAKKVVDNRKDELGKTQSSSFYQVGGKKLYPGMVLQERKDCGLGFSGGYSFTKGALFRFDLNLGQRLNIPVKQLKLYGEMIIADKDIAAKKLIGSMPETKINYTFGKFSFGVLKEFPIVRNYHLGGFIGWTRQHITWGQSNYSLNGEQIIASGINWGIKAGTNLFIDKIQFIATFNNHNYIKTGYKEYDNTETTPLDYTLSDIFPDMNSFSIDLSIRITL